MRRELGLLNFICILVALGFLALAVISVLSSGDFLTTDNLFIITVSLVMALMFAASPAGYLYSEGKLPVPFLKRRQQQSLPASPAGNPAQMRAAAPPPPLLDAKGRAVPPDVRAIVAGFGHTEAKDAS